MISKPRGRRAVNLQILPSAMTVLSVCAGLTSIRFALEHQPKAAMALIAAAAILDGLDGRVARILDAQSRMGEEIDSLADAVNFGVTPAIVLYVTLLTTSPAGWVAILLYAVCVVLRLARFNALLDDGSQPAYTHEFFVGMPAPAGAVSMIGLIGLKLQFGDGWWTSPLFLCIWITGTSILMVSKIPMRKMHAVAVPPSWAAPLLAVLAICAAADHRRLPVPRAVRGAQPALAGRAPRGVVGDAAGPAQAGQARAVTGSGSARQLTLTGPSTPVAASSACTRVPLRPLAFGSGTRCR